MNSVAVAAIEALNNIARTSGIATKRSCHALLHVLTVRDPVRPDEAAVLRCYCETLLAEIFGVRSVPERSFVEMYIGATFGRSCSRPLSLFAWQDGAILPAF